MPVEFPRHARVGAPGRGAHGSQPCVLDGRHCQGGPGSVFIYSFCLLIFFFFCLLLFFYLMAVTAREGQVICHCLLSEYLFLGPVAINASRYAENNKKAFSTISSYDRCLLVLGSHVIIIIIFIS